MARSPWRNYFEVPIDALEVIAQQHGAIDPDTGHIVCHQHKLGVAVVEVDGEKLPVLVIGGCVAMTVGEDNVRALLSKRGVREHDRILLRNGKLLLGDVELDGYWGLAVLSYLREKGARIRAFEIVLEFEGRAVKVAGFLVEGQKPPIMLMIPEGCSEEAAQTHM